MKRKKYIFWWKDNSFTSKKEIFPKFNSGKLYIYYICQLTCFSQNNRIHIPKTLNYSKCWMTLSIILLMIMGFRLSASLFHVFKFKCFNLSNIRISYEFVHCITMIHLEVLFVLQFPMNKRQLNFSNNIKSAEKLVSSEIVDTIDILFKLN